MKTYKFLKRAEINLSTFHSVISSVESEVNNYAEQGWRVVSCSLCGELSYQDLIVILEKDC